MPIITSWVILFTVTKMARPYGFSIIMEVTQVAILWSLILHSASARVHCRQWILDQIRPSGLFLFYCILGSRRSPITIIEWSLFEYAVIMLLLLWICPLPFALRQMNVIQSSKTPAASHLRRTHGLQQGLKQRFQQVWYRLALFWACSFLSQMLSILPLFFSRFQLP